LLSLVFPSSNRNSSNAIADPFRGYSEVSVGKVDKMRTKTNKTTKTTGREW
jgi:hypothetical protein